MSNHSELNSYIAKLQQRLRLGTWLRGAAIFTGTALAVTVAMVLVLNQFAFPAHGVTAARLTMFVALAVAALFGIAVPLIRGTRPGYCTARYCERFACGLPIALARLSFARLCESRLVM